MNREYSKGFKDGYYKAKNEFERSLKTFERQVKEAHERLVKKYEHEVELQLNGYQPDSNAYYSSMYIRMATHIPSIGKYLNKKDEP